MRILILILFLSCSNPASDVIEPNSRIFKVIAKGRLNIRSVDFNLIRNDSLVFEVSKSFDFELISTSNNSQIHYYSNDKILKIDNTINNVLIVNYHYDYKKNALVNK